MSRFDFISGFFSWGKVSKDDEFIQSIEKELDKLSKEEE